jgi:hypothetical protein
LGRSSVIGINGVTSDIVSAKLIVVIEVEGGGGGGGGGVDLEGLAAAMAARHSK